MKTISRHWRGAAALLLALAVAGLPGCGKGARSSRVYVIGVDGATFDLMKPWLAAGDLPNLKGLMDAGVYGELTSIYPILSPVAWTSMATGTNPGKHGIFDFERPDPTTPGRSLLYTSENRRAEPVWNLLSNARKSVAVLNVPMTWPPDPVNGVMVSGFPFPEKTEGISYTYPKELQDKLGNYPLDAMGEGLVPGAEGAKLAEIVDSRDAVQRIGLDWITTRKDDFTWIVFTATDRVQHFFWSMMDPKHPYYTPALGAKYGEAIHDFWRGMDKKIGELLKAIPPDATVLVVSDHGFGPIYREVNTINWFRQTPMNDYVKTHQVPDVFITNGIFRYRLGTTYPMNPEYENFRSMFIKEAGALTDPKDGGHPIQRVLRREELFNGPMVPKGPDLVMIEAKDCYIGTGDPEKNLDPVTDLHSTSYSAYHRPNGIFIARGPGIARGELNGASLLDVAPTILHLMGQPVPTDMDGRVLNAIFQPAWLKDHPPKYTDGIKILADKPERELTPAEKDRLTSTLPYLK